MARGKRIPKEIKEVPAAELLLPLPEPEPVLPKVATIEDCLYFISMLEKKIERIETFLTKSAARGPRITISST